VENEPKTLARADLPLLQPRYPVPLPGPLEQAIRQEAGAALRNGEPDAARLLALTRRLGAETARLRPPLAVA
jgi:hypothetical protein